MIINMTLSEFREELRVSNSIYLCEQDGGMYGQCIHFYYSNGVVAKVSGYNSTNNHFTVHGEVQESSWSETPWADLAAYHQSKIDSKRRHLKSDHAYIQRWIALFEEGRTHTRGLSLKDFKHEIGRHIVRFNAMKARFTTEAAYHQAELDALNEAQAAEEQAASMRGTPDITHPDYNSIPA